RQRYSTWPPRASDGIVAPRSGADPGEGSRASHQASTPAPRAPATTAQPRRIVSARRRVAVGLDRGPGEVELGRALGVVQGPARLPVRAGLVDRTFAAERGDVGAGGGAVRVLLRGLRRGG